MTLSSGIFFVLLSTFVWAQTKLGVCQVERRSGLFFT